MEVLKPDSSTNTSRLASKRLASHRHRPSGFLVALLRLSCDFFSRTAKPA